MLQRHLIAAARRRDKRSALQSADEALHELRVLVRQSHMLGLLTLGQFTHISPVLDEVGRLLGGWRKTQTPAKAPSHHSDTLQPISDENAST
ncbi:MAG: hypothetical protein GFH27_549291n71 [Chloroflexi bacterium AL-W]|nr:hypothetical protein [Chloroflexi bacterium AL-N1]NOK67462.1 hypothetical protein [Chloroflexi bacterium AL-N10]NOK75046.1 hypothetical protein [Chloroflexi bacterium AL-N5]NOK81833.1 hypothetical protein [Chloroflexi bacterium AL-W]NOK89679.1 hypothetical protein [Chloroflexi bacterium AL-N15]